MTFVVSHSVGTKSCHRNLLNKDTKAPIIYFLVLKDVFCY